MDVDASSLAERLNERYKMTDTQNSTKHFDYFVIGAGSGGVRSARYAAAHGAKVKKYCD